MKSEINELETDIEHDEQTIQANDEDDLNSEPTIYEECAIEIVLNKKAPKTYASVLQEM